ncbi:12075_t:CDS:2 [Funneliformis mosseae]|uniref:12075_t:CDS:1 n=1 Tax=Funneliformis mosseae TaxID=27381 RepID=A0A9N8V7D6_FUNMO|nr:12075_t:CDS:2 [Funneliformis mosseae]
MAKRISAMSQFTEFYSKVCVAGSVKFVIDEASKREISLSESDQFSRNLVTILARNSEVVAINLKIYPKNVPMTFVQAAERKNVSALFFNVLEYCSVKLKTKRLNKVYGGTGRQLDRETINHIYLHAELNILTNTDVLSKEHNEFIAVSKKCCYLCESYIEFLRSKGYKITVSEAHKKLYPGWKLPDTYNKEFVENNLCDLDQIIESAIEQHTKLIAKSDIDGESADSDNQKRNYVDD